jgi:hypothetical protein
MDVVASKLHGDRQEWQLIDRMAFQVSEDALASGHECGVIWVI